MIRLSLRTASPHQVRTRAAELDLAKGAMMEQMPVLRRNVKPGDMPALYKRAFERQLDRVVMAQFQEPGHVRFCALIPVVPRQITPGRKRTKFSDMFSE
jgi:hypothetical protein